MKKVLQRALSFGVLLSMSLVFTSTGFAQEADTADLEQCRQEAAPVLEAAIKRFEEELAAEHPILGGSGLSSFEGYGGDPVNSFVDYVSPLSNSFVNRFSGLKEGWEGVVMITDEFSAGVQKEVDTFTIGGEEVSCNAGATINLHGDIEPHISLTTSPYDNNLSFGLFAQPDYVGFGAAWGF